MRQQMLGIYSMTLDEARKMLEGVPCDRCAELPFAGAKHPGWVLGHLCLGSGMGAAMLGGSTDESDMCGVPAAWAGPCMAEPNGQRGSYAKKDQLLAELERIHGVFADRIRNASDALLASPLPKAEWRSFWPTMGDMVFYMTAYHEGYHLGQMSQWKKAALR